MDKISLYLLIFFFLFFNTSITICQNEEGFLQKDTASIQKALKRTKKIWQTNQDSALFLLQEILDLSKQLGYPKGQLLALRDLGNYHYQRGTYNFGKIQSLQALGIAKKYDYEDYFADLFNHLALSYRRGGQLDSAFHYFTLAEKKFLADGEDYELWRIYSGLGRLFSEKGEPEKAEMYFEKAFKIVKDKNKRADLGYVIYMLGTFYFQQERFDKFAFYSKEWQEFQNQKKGVNKIKQDERHSNFVTFLPKGDSTIERMTRAYKYELAQGNYFVTGVHLQNLGFLVYEKEDYSKALDIYQQSAQYLEKSRPGYFLSNSYKNIYELGKKLDKTDLALSFLEKYNYLNDSLQTAAMEEILAELEVKYETEKNKQTLRFQTLELGQKTLQRNLFLGSSFFLALLALAIFLGLRSRLRANRKIAVQSNKIQQQKINQLEQEKKILAFNSVIEGQEKERMRIAADLHDSLGGLLTSVKAHFNTLPLEQQNQPIKMRYEKTNRLIDDACVELRRISHNMMPRALSLSGLKGALEDLVQNIEEQGIVCKMELFGLEKRLPKTKAVMLYRIFQELIGNVLKHAKANNLLIQVMRHEEELIVLVEDDGSGFNLAEAKLQKGMGLSSIESRVKFLNGSLYWDSVIGQGTTVNIQFPITFNDN